MQHATCDMHSGGESWCRAHTTVAFGRRRTVFRPQMLEGWGAYHDSMSGEASGKAWADAWARKATMVRVNALAPCAVRLSDNMPAVVHRTPDIQRTPMLFTYVATAKRRPCAGRRFGLKADCCCVTRCRLPVAGCTSCCMRALRDRRPAWRVRRGSHVVRRMLRAA